MKFLLPLLILVFSLTAFSQEIPKSIDQLKKEAKTFKHNRYYAAGYDKFTDKSIVSFSGSAIGGKTAFALGGTLVTFGIDFFFKGQELKASPDSFIWKFVGYSEGIKNSLSDSTLYVLADGERFEIKEGLQNSKINTDILGDLKTTESLSFVVSRDNLKKFANAKTLEIKVGNKPYTIDSQHQQIFKDILTVSQLAQHVEI